MDEILDRVENLSIQEMNGQPAALDGMPPEMKIAIMKSIPDIPTLKSLMQSSPGYHYAFVSERHEILCAVSGLVNIRPEVLIEAIAVKEASIPGSDITPLWTVSLDERRRLVSLVDETRIQQYHSSRSTLVPAFKYEGTEKLNAFHLTICSLTEHFISTALSRHPITGRHHMDKLEDLSKCEVRRIQRAFYRFELFQRFFPQEAAGQDDRFSLRFGEMARMFFSAFEPFEVEEIACVHGYAWGVYAAALKAFSSQLLPKDVSPGGIFWRHNIDGFMLPGLEFLHIFINSPASTQLQLLKDNLIYCWPSMTRELLEPAAHPLLYTDKYEEFLEKNDDTLNFAGDDAKGPNAGWVWANHGTWNWEYYEPRNHTKRIWGYVFWDKMRLDKWGVLEADTEEPWDQHPAHFWSMY